ncbi:carbohydrate ABC transporter permease [Tengunoibacter tsumagoiensis]|uniref:Transporter n=1 Tax=Tengunoibacter tsumagoiensis TaxID=2014871 RepID=A0A402AA37_9CHLR|nr:sugar ABC transporter permease [Tengunoibacter tsumagoiensis]GCE15896.1 transporter [Tengunoibacter tsumagoiensis]
MSSSFDLDTQSAELTVKKTDAFKASVGQPKRSNSPFSSKRWRRDLIALIIFTGPAILWYLFFMVGPFASMFYYSTLNWGSLLAPKYFDGLHNYTYMFNDPTFYIALRNTAVHIGVTIPILIPISFLLGYYLSLRPPGYQFLNVVCFTPTLMSAVAATMLFIGIYAPNGIINALLNAVHLQALTHLWNADTSTALGSIIGINLWGGIGFCAVVFAARLSGISSELYEAAQIDGATHWEKIRFIAFPMARDFVGVMTMLQFLGLLLGSAQTVLLLTKGGPGTSSTTISFLLYNEAFVSSHLGYSQAIGTFLFFVSVLGMLLIRSLFRPAY